MNVLRTTAVLDQATAHQRKPEGEQLPVPVADGGTVFADVATFTITKVMRLPCNHTREESCNPQYVYTIECYQNQDDFMEGVQLWLNEAELAHARFTNAPLN